MNRVPPTDDRPALQPPRFRLRTLLWGVGLLCVFFAVSSTLGGYALFALVLLVLSILAHVAGNALGMRLRANGSSRLPLGEEEQRRRSAGYAPPQRGEVAPATWLGQRYSLGKPILLLTALGVIGGAAGGWVLLNHMYGQATLINLSAGTFACGVLGGIWSFLGVGFLQVLVAAVWQASR